MEKIRTLDISGINCWIVNLKPFDASSEEIYRFQRKCVSKRVFGIGWYRDGFEGTLEKQKDSYLKDEGKTSKRKATEAMNTVDIGDIVMMRLKDGHYYIGCVSKRAFHDNSLFENEKDNKIMSWTCEVQEWFEYKSDEELPAGLCGRFSNRRQSTVTRVATYRAKLLMIAAYERKSGNKIFDVPQINLTVDNFARALNYMELEDLVCAYIHNKHYPDNYMLLPSSGKVSRIKYEFTFVNGNQNKKPITCQVKNQNKDPIKLSAYIEDMDIYEKIYIFSGNNNIIRDAEVNNIEIIEPSELFDTLTNYGYMSFVRDKLKKYYTFDNHRSDIEYVEQILKNSGWEQTNQLAKGRGKAKKNELKYQILSAVTEDKDEGSVTRWILLEHDGFFYSEDYGCFIISQNNIRNDKISDNINAAQ